MFLRSYKPSVERPEDIGEENTPPQANQDFGEFEEGCGNGQAVVREAAGQEVVVGQVGGESGGRVETVRSGSRVEIVGSGSQGQVASGHSTVQVTGQVKGMTSGQFSGVVPVSLEEISSILPCFSGNSGENVDHFVNCIQYARRIFAVNDEVMKLILMKQLKLGAQRWSMSQELFLKPLEECLHLLKSTFTMMESKFMARKKMEKRRWINGEKFLDYANDKCMLAAALNLEENELVEYLVDGIQDEALQNQARINRFQTVAELVRAFGMVQTKPVFKPKVCYSCNQPGHVAANCGISVGQLKGQQKGGNFGAKQFDETFSRTTAGGGPLNREWRRGQPGGALRETSGGVTSGGTSNRGPPTGAWIGAVEDENDRADLVGQTAGSDGLVDIRFKNSFKNLKALFDTGSPVSLVKFSKVFGIEILSFEQNKILRGLGGKQIKILGKIISDVTFQNFSFRTEFLVVADTDLSSFDAIIGRDIIMKPGIKTVIEENKIKIFETPIFESEKPGNCEKSKLDSLIVENIGNIRYDQLAKFKNVFQQNYLEYKRPLKQEIDYEMKITLKTGTPFHYKPRRLSYSEKEKVNKKVDELLKAGIIKESNSPFASPYSKKG